MHVDKDIYLFVRFVHINFYNMLEKISIPEDLFEQCLTNYLGEKSRKLENEGKDEATLLFRLSKTEMFERKRGDEYPFIGNFKPSEDEVKVLMKYTTSENIQIKAYSNDVCSNYIKGIEKITMVRSVSEDYLWLYEHCHTPRYLLRAITVRKYKGLNDYDFLEKITSILQRKIYPGWMKEICKALYNMKYSKEDLLSVSNLIKEEINKIENKSEKSNMFDEFLLLDALFELGFITINELHFKKAIVCEKEYDYRKSENEDHIIAYNLQSIEDSFNEIKYVKNIYKDDYCRIMRKYYMEQKDFSEKFNKMGIRTEYEIPKDLIEEIINYVESLKLSNPVEILQHIISISFLNRKLIDYEFKENELGLMFKRKNLGSSGQIIGTASPEDSSRINYYLEFRLKMRFFINQYLKKSSELYNMNNEEEFIKFVCRNCSLKYIDDGHKLLWCKGFVQAFSGEYILAVHLLVPQIEHYLRKKAESIYGPLHKLENVRQQDEPTLTNILELLKNHFKEDLYHDFRLFFNAASDVNMRNNIAHGLWGYNEILKHAPYCIWLAIKIYFVKMRSL